jgi:hypothetical protein
MFRQRHPRIELGFFTASRQRLRVPLLQALGQQLHFNLQLISFRIPGLQYPKCLTLNSFSISLRRSPPGESGDADEGE